jgi:hypothetical protein
MVVHLNSKPSKLFSAMLAVVGFEVGLFVATWTASIFSLALGSVYHGGRHDTCGHSYDGVTKYHDET